eukprot:g37461.t1
MREAPRFEGSEPNVGSSRPGKTVLCPYDWNTSSSWFDCETFVRPKRYRLLLLGASAKTQEKLLLLTCAFFSDFITTKGKSSSFIKFFFLGGNGIE